MTLFFCGLLTGVAACLACTRLIIAGVVGWVINVVLERFYRDGFIGVDPAHEAEFLQAIEDAKRIPWGSPWGSPWDLSGNGASDSGPH
jgi:hypothetical protein